MASACAGASWVDRGRAQEEREEREDWEGLISTYTQQLPLPRQSPPF
jgi:hypothetical protein